MNLLRNDVYNLFVNTQMRIKIYRKFYESIIYIAIEGRHVRIVFKINEPAGVCFVVFCLEIVCSLDLNVYL